MRTDRSGPLGANTLPASFSYAISGLLFALRHERNFRIHCCAAAYVLYFSRYYPFGRTEYALILLLLGLVMACELLNTAVEKSIDMTTPAFNPLAKVAKDVAAGAVLVSALVSVGVGILLFWEPEILGQILLDIRSGWLVWLFLLALTLAWIFLPQQRRPVKRP